ncbi:MAG: hypothetical protein FWG64_14785 [Firmicutes bacterium]|nr:hypothetical protein [Bacillota bacterium]
MPKKFAKPLSIVFSLLVLFLSTTCTTTENPPITQNSELHKITLSSENRYLLSPSTVVFMGIDGNIFMSSHERTSQFGELNIHRFEEIFGGFGMPELYTIENATVQFPTVSISDDYFYIPLVFSENFGEPGEKGELVETQKIVKLNSAVPPMILGENTQRQATIIREMPQVSYINFFVDGDNMIIFEPIFEDESEIFIYQIINRNLQENSENVIIAREFSTVTNFGEIIANIFVQNASIFLYRVEISQNGTRNFYIEEYDFAGNFVNRLNLDIENALYMPEVSAEDSVMQLFITDNLVILQTLHNRILMYAIVGNSLIEVDIPASLQRLGAANIIGNSFDFDGNGLILFWNFNDQTLYLLDLQQWKFSTANVFIEDNDISQFLQQNVNRIHRDVYGNLLFEVAINYQAYLDFIEEQLQAERTAGEFTPRGAALFVVGDNVFYSVDIAEIEQIIGRQN